MRPCFSAVVFLLLMAVLASLSYATGVQSEYVGAQACGVCHKAAYQAWKQSPHANAQQALTGKQIGDARCVQCHGLADRGKSGVQCESCHGLGQHYARDHVMKDAELARLVGLQEMDEKICRQCHSESAPNVRPFDYARLWELIRHGHDPDRPVLPKT